MYYFFFYFFCAISVLSAAYAVFFDRSKLASITIFMFSVSGILVLMNAGYIAYLLMFSALLYYSIKKIKTVKELTGNKNGNNYFIYITISSVFGAIIASVTGSTMWQGNVLLNHEITLSNLFVNTSIEYFIFFLLIFSALPVILPFIKFRGEN